MLSDKIRKIVAALSKKIVRLSEDGKSLWFQDDYSDISAGIPTIRNLARPVKQLQDIKNIKCEYYDDVDDQYHESTANYDSNSLVIRYEVDGSPITRVYYIIDSFYKAFIGEVDTTK